MRQSYRAGYASAGSKPAINHPIAPIVLEDPMCQSFLFVTSAEQPRNKQKKWPTTHGDTVMSCSLIELHPKPDTVVDVKNVREPEGLHVVAYEIISTTQILITTS